MSEAERGSQNRGQSRGQTRGLGRGLSALLGEQVAESAPVDEEWRASEPVAQGRLGEAALLIGEE